MPLPAHGQCTSTHQQRPVDAIAHATAEAICSEGASGDAKLLQGPPSSHGAAARHATGERALRMGAIITAGAAIAKKRRGLLAWAQSHWP